MEVVRSGSCVSTGVRTDKHQFTWTVEDFDLIRSSKDLIRSQEVKIEIGESIDFKTKWSVRLYDYQDDNRTPWVGLFLSLEESPEGIGDVLASFQVKVLMQENQVHSHLIDTKNPFRNYVNERSWAGSWPKVVRKDWKLEQLPLVDGNLILEIHVTLLAPKSFLQTRRDSALILDTFTDKFGEKLKSDLGKMLDASGTTDEDEITADFPTKIISNDLVEFPVNRGILSARSSVFERMFQADMSETRTGIVQIEDLSSKTIEVLLQYIYSGTLHNDWSSSEVIVELVNAAGKYQLLELLEFLDQVLGNVCDKETAGKLLLLAKKLELKNAEQVLFEYVKKNASTFDEMLEFFKEELDKKEIVLV